MCGRKRVAGKLLGHIVKPRTSRWAVVCRVPSEVTLPRAHKWVKETPRLGVRRGAVKVDSGLSDRQGELPSQLETSPVSNPSMKMTAVGSNSSSLIVMVVVPKVPEVISGMLKLPSSMTIVKLPS